jgi:hypothetical protein
MLMLVIGFLITGAGTDIQAPESRSGRGGRSNVPVAASGSPDLARPGRLSRLPLPGRGLLRIGIAANSIQ